jgi:hypothetical protein
MNAIILDYSFIESGETFTGSIRLNRDNVPKVNTIIPIEHKNVRVFLSITHVWPAALVQGQMRVAVDGDLVDLLV